ncbi:MAG: DUF4838 domain-containing protein [Victivallales bacterium]|nr:DUF4838 domain-containing protein [Victivallales bacterium]
MKKTLACLLVLVGILCGVPIDWNNPALNPIKAEKHGSKIVHTLFENGKSDCVIVIPSKTEDLAFPWLATVPSATKNKPEYNAGVAGYAAMEFRQFLKAVSGVELPVIVGDIQIPDGKYPIFIGSSAMTARHGFTNDGAKEEGFVIKVENKGMCILGAAPCNSPHGQYKGEYGVIFGVYDFLERALGLRFFYPGPDGTIIPRLDKLELPEISYQDAPDLSLRIMYSLYSRNLPGYKDVDTMKIALRYRAGGHGEGSSILPGHWRKTVELGMAQAVQADGCPIKTYPPMPCFSNPRTLEAYLENHGKYNNTYHVLPPDHAIKCQCPFCAPLYRKDVPFHEMASGVYDSFIKRAAEALKKEKPNALLFFTAYYNYVSPVENLVLPDNTKAQICLMYGQSLYHDPRIKNITRKWIRDWNRITGKPVNVYVYPNWPGIAYSPFPRQYYHNLKAFFQENKGLVDGVFSDGPNSGGVDAIEGAPYAFALPTLYCEFRLMWNADYDVDAGVLDFCQKMYGPAWKPMHEIFTGIAELFEGRRTVGLDGVMHLGEYEAGQIAKKDLYTKIITPDDVKKIKECLEKAYSMVAKDSPEWRRIDLHGRTLSLFFIDYEQFHKPEASTSKKCLVAKFPFMMKIEDKAAYAGWEKVKPYGFVNAYLSHGPEPPHATTVQFAYDKCGILYRFVMQEPDMKNVFISPKELIWDGDCLEVFTEYAPDVIYQTIFNVNNDMYDSFIGTPRKRAGGPLRHIEKKDDSWILTLYLPFSTLDASIPFTGDNIVHFNAARTRKQKGGYRHISRWNTTFARAHADKDAFGTLVFEK